MLRNEIELKYQDLIRDCDLMIKSGQMNQVIALMSELVVSQVPRSARQGFAKCCRRVGLIAMGMRLLHPVVRGQKLLDEPVRAHEICEYSALLARNGSVSEALDLLKTVDSKSAAEALLYQGQCHILNWEYAEAVQCFQNFLTSSGDDYSKLIARVNLISGYIVLFRLNEAVEVLQETIALAQGSGASRLLANCYELWGQVYFWQNDFANARQMLNRASEIFNNAQSLDQLLIHKTESIMKALEDQSVTPLIQFRTLAMQRKNWESVREADLFMLKVAPDQKKLDHLIFGTPKAAYRRRIEKLVGALPNSSYVLGTETGLQLNLRTGLADGNSSLPIGKKVHQVISILCRDFYAPINMGTLFFELYPDEYFDVDSSPFRIRQAILRARQWLIKNKVPAVIHQSKGAYRFVVTGEIGVQLSLDYQTVHPNFTRWQQLLERHSPGQNFTSDAVCNQLGWSRTTFRRLADWACDNGLLNRSGVGKATTYQIISTDASQNTKKAS